MNGGKAREMGVKKAPTIFSGALFPTVLRRTACLACVLIFAGAIGGFLSPLSAQTPTANGDGESADAPKQPKRSIIRFLTANDYPPFNYDDEDGVLTGFNVDLARAICLELDVTCNVEPRDWEKLLPSLGKGDADAIIASIKVTPGSLKLADFSDRYYFTPGRFVSRKKFAKYDMTPVGLEGRTVAVVKGSAHEAFINRYFRDCKVVIFDSDDAARQALKDGKVELMFGDGMGLMFWINGTQSRGCCEFRGGAFSDQRYFGDGIGIAVRKGDHTLRKQINKALAVIRRTGRLEELFLRYFPMKVY